MIYGWTLDENDSFCGLLPSVLIMLLLRELEPDKVLEYSYINHPQWAMVTICTKSDSRHFLAAANTLLGAVSLLYNHFLGCFTPLGG